MTIHILAPSPHLTAACGIVFPIIAGIAVALRFYCRYLQRTTILIDDWLTIPAWIFMTGMGICLALGVKHHAYAYPSPEPPPGTDPKSFNAPEIIWNRKLEYALEMFQFPAITCIKLSFLFFYRRIFVTPATKLLNLILWTVIVICTMWGIAFLFAFGFVCDTHFRAFWGTPRVFQRHCSRIIDENFWIAITDFALDVVVFVIPIPLIWRLRLSFIRKIGLMTVLLVGGLTVAASITRMVIFVHALQLLRTTYKSSRTNNQLVTAGLYWTVFECGIGLIAACLPAIYVLFKRFLETYFGLKTSTDKSSTWTSGRFQNDRFKRIQVDTVTEIEFMPIPTQTATRDTAGENDLYRERYESQEEGRARSGILVHKPIRQPENRVEWDWNLGINIEEIRLAARR